MVTDDGLGYYDYISNEFINFPTSKYTTDNPEKDMQVLNCIIQDNRGRFWIGSRRGGFGYFDYKDGDAIEIRMIGEADGLRNDEVKKLEKDRLGNIWGLNDIGIFKLSPDDFKIENYGEEYGLYDTDNTEFYIRPDNTMWLTFDNQYLYKINVDSLVAKKTPPSVYLKHFYNYIAIITIM